MHYSSSRFIIVALIAACTLALLSATSVRADYHVTAVNQLPNGLAISLALSTPGPYASTDLNPLLFTVTHDTNSRLHIKVTVVNQTRWEIPTSVLPLPSADPVVHNPLYAFSYQMSPFSFAVTRTSDQSTIFNTTNHPFIMQDQFISLTTAIHPDSAIFGLGERVETLNLPRNHVYTLWNIDHSATDDDENLYGSHPFYLELLPNGQSHGVFLRNSNGMDVIVNQTTLTYNVIGGLLDFYFFLGPSPQLVTQQYHTVIGFSHMPPFWSLGWHQCRWGYANIQQVEDVVTNYSRAGIPLDVMWTDIDHMDAYHDFTFDPKNYPVAQVKAFVDKLHSQDQHYVVIVDPGIANITGYTPYDSGIAADIFIKRANGQDFIGKVWPGFTAFPDWFHPLAASWWEKSIQPWFDSVGLSGLWIDMNEISNFCDGQCESAPTVSEKKSLDVTFDPNNPPYHIHNSVDGKPLKTKTIDMDCNHHGGLLEYNTNNLFGFMESIATKQALENMLNKRSFVLSRSTFPGQGHHAAHWLGDNYSTWSSLMESISGILNMNLFGIPLVGADICGFNGDTNEELCVRWTEVGAFYPFSRNHNSIGQIAQEPYVWASVTRVSKTVLAARYSLLSWLSTQFFLSHSEGGAVARALWYNFPEDSATFSIHTQFMLGSALLISPVLTQGATSVQAYLPPSARWFNFWDYSPHSTTGMQTLSAPLEFINVHIAGGNIITRQQPQMTSASTRKTPITLVVAPNMQGLASGNLFLDDGVELTVGSNSLFATYSSEPVSSNSFSLIGVVAVKGQLDSITANTVINSIVILGSSSAVTSATLDSASLPASQISYNSQVFTVTFSGLNINVSNAFKLTWSH